MKFWEFSIFFFFDNFCWIPRLILIVFLTFQNPSEFYVPHVRTSKFLFETTLWCIKCQHFIWYTCPSTKHEKIHFSVEVPKRWVLNLRNFISAGFVSWFCSFFPKKNQNFWNCKNCQNFCVSHVWASKFFLETIFWYTRSQNFIMYMFSITYM